MTENKGKLLDILILYAIFIGFLIGYFVGIVMCKKMPEKFGIVKPETECSCCCEMGGAENG